MADALDRHPSTPSAAAPPTPPATAPGDRAPPATAAPQTLGAGDCLSAADWVKKSRALAPAAARAVAYDELDTLLQGPSEEAVAGHLRVMHDPTAFEEGTEHVLHLKDVPVLDPKGGDLNAEDDALENAGLLESERRAFKHQSTKKAYDVYADLEGRVTGILPQYDADVLEFRQKEFRLDATGERNTAADLSAIRSKLQKVKDELKDEVRLEYSLEPMRFGIKVQSEYETPAEVKFKKPKKVDQSARRKALDLVAVLEANAPPAPAAEEGEDPDHRPRHASLKTERDAERALALLRGKEAAYEVAKRRAEEARAAVRALAAVALTDDAEEAAAAADTAPGPRVENEDENGNIVFDPTEEFARTVAVSTDDDFFSRQRKRQELMANHRRQEKEPATSSSSASGPTAAARAAAAEAREARGAEEDRGDTLLEEHRRNIEEVQVFYEPQAGGSLSDALKLIQQKGWISQEFSGRQNDRVIDLRVHDPAPQVKIERKDETGREMTQKEAWRRLSHKFHGKAPGKLKQEKKIKRFKEEKTMVGMDATDTPLASLKALQNAQQVTRSPFVVIQGGGMDHMGLAPLLSKKDKRRGDDQPGGSESTVAKRLRR